MLKPLKKLELTVVAWNYYDSLSIVDYIINNTQSKQKISYSTPIALTNKDLVLLNFFIALFDI